MVERADRCGDRRRAGQRPGPRRGRDRRADRHLRPARRPVAAAERLLPVSPARRRRRRLARPGRRHGRGERGAGRCSGAMAPKSSPAQRFTPSTRAARCATAGTTTSMWSAADSCWPASRRRCWPACWANRRRRRPPGAQVKVNMVLQRLPRLRDNSVTPEQAFGGTLHVNETWTQLDAAYSQAAARAATGSAAVRDLLPFADRPEHPVPRAARRGRSHDDGVRSAHAAFVFGGATPRVRDRLTDAVLTSLNSVLAEPIQDVLLSDAHGRPCIETTTTLDLEQHAGDDRRQHLPRRACRGRSPTTTTRWTPRRGDGAWPPPTSESCCAARVRDAAERSPASAATTPRWRCWLAGLS